MTTITRDWQVLIEGILLGGDDYELLGAEGLDLPSFRSSDSLRPLADGAFVGTDLLGPRRITLDIGVAGGSHDEILRRIRDLKTAFRPTRELREFRLRLPGETERVLFARPRGVGFPLEGSVGGVEIACRFFAPDPRFFGSEERKSNDAPTADTPRSYDLTFDRTYGPAGTRGSVVVDNIGTVDTHPTFRITGRAAGPIIENRSTRQRMEFDLTVEQGDSLEIDTYERTVLLNGTSRYSRLSGTSEWIVLPPGGNEILFLNGHGGHEGSAEDAGRLRVTWRPAYL